METHSPESSLVGRLDSFSFEETRLWLVEALHGRQRLPLISPDEVRHIGILRLEQKLSKETRRDLAKACLQLVHEFARSGQADEEYLNSLLRLAVHFRLDELSISLAKLATEFPRITELPISSRKLVLAAIVDLKIPQMQEFWRSILKQDPVAYGGMVVSGLLATKASAAIDMLSALPDDQALADAVAIILEQTASQLPTRDRAELIAQVQAVLSRCRPVLRASIEEWLAEIGTLAAPSRANPGLLKTSIRNLEALRKGLKKFDPSLEPCPASARLCA